MSRKHVIGASESIGTCYVYTEYITEILVNTWT